MSKIVTTIKATIAIAAIVVAAGGGFKVGEYWQAEKMWKAAIAHECASINTQTLEPSWRLPIDMGITMDALPDIAPVKPKKVTK